MNNNYINNAIEFNLEINNFKGPFDLLLSMIKEKKMDILSLNLYEITQQYLVYINKNISLLKIDDVSEYLLIATYLLELKSKRVLPIIETVEKLNEDIERDKFIQRLLVYKQYQNILPDLVQKLSLRTKMHENETNTLDTYFENFSDSSDESYNFIPTLESVDINKIIKAMQKIYLKLQTKKETNIKLIDVSEISIDDVEKDIKLFLENNFKEKMTLYDFLDSVPDEKFSKQYFVVAFVAILVLVANYIITIEQDEKTNDIFIYKVNKKGDNNEL